jgi:hypothetical protein
MNKAGYCRMLFTLICIFFVAGFGCDFLKEKITTDEVEYVPDECNKVFNLFSNTLKGLYETGQVSQLQVTRAANKFEECLIDEGLTGTEARDIIRDYAEEIREETEEEEGKEPKQMFVF